MNQSAITVLCLNPALDVTYNVKTFVPDKKNYAHATRFDPGGNGLNVARALFRLKRDGFLIAPLAGETGRMIARLCEGQIAPPLFMNIPGESRINGTIIVEDSGFQFEINGIGPTLPSTVLERIQTLMLASARDGFAVLTGSIPPGVPETIYAELAKALKEENARVIVDAKSSLLQQALPAAPFLIKPNRHELEGLTGLNIATLEDALKASQQVRHQYGIGWVCTSMGEEGAMLVGKEGAWVAKAPMVPVVSTVGSGDSMVAALVAGFAMNQSPAEILKMAVACGSGTAMMPGTELFDPEALPLVDDVQFFQC